MGSLAVQALVSNCRPGSWQALRVALVVIALAVGGGPGVVSNAFAVPHPSCLGTCDDGSACGAKSDCAEAAECTFADACWPGLARLIKEVVPEYPGGIGDAETGWLCNDLSCTNKDGILVLSNTGNRAGFARKDLAFSAGRRYGLRALLSVSAGATLKVSVDGAGGPVGSETFVGPIVSIPVMIEFPVTAGASGKYELILELEGSGEASFGEAFATVLREHGVFLRLSVPPEAGPLTFRNSDIWRDGADGLPRHHGSCVVDYAGDQPCLSTSRFAVPTGPDGKTAWLDWAALTGGKGIALHRIEFLETGATAWPVAIEVAHAPDDSAVVYRGSTDGSARSFLFALPESGSSASALTGDTGLAVDGVMRDIGFATAALGGVSGIAPLAGAMMPVSGADGTDNGALFRETSFELAAWLGQRTFEFHKDLNVIERDRGISGTTRVVALHDWWMAAGADVDGDVFPDWDADTLDERFGAWLDTRMELAVALESRGDARIVVDLGPLRFMPWRGTNWRNAFRGWVPQRGLQPEAFGVDSWSELQPPEGIKAIWPERSRPLRQEVEAARRWQAGLRFLTERTADAYRALVRVLKARGVDRVQAAAGSIVDSAAAGFGVGPDIYQIAELARLDGITFDRGGSGDHACRAWELAAWTAWARGLASPALERAAFGGTPFEFGMASKPTPGTDARSAAVQLAIAGFSQLVHKGYGPSPFGGSDAFGGHGAATVGQLSAIAGLNETLGRALAALGTTATGRAAVAIFGGQSDYRWVDVPAASEEEIGWYTMFSHAGWPVEVVAEDEIALGLLERPDQARTVLVMLRRHVSRAAWSVIQSWVERGGHLVTGADLPIFDEYGQLVLARASWFGVDVGSSPVGRGQLNSYQWQTADGSVTFQSTIPWRETFALSGSVIATVDERRPVAVRFPRGRGRVTVSGIALGEAYLAPIRACEESGSGLVAGWSDGIRRAGEGVLRAAGMRVDHVVKGSGVQLRAFGTSQKPFLAVITHNNRPMNFVFESRSLQRCESLRDILRGGDAYVNLGSVLASVNGAAIFTWNPSDCTVSVVEPRPEKPVEPEPEPVLADEGCSGGPSGFLWLVFAVFGVRRRRRV